jgi:hypothetical protein
MSNGHYSILLYSFDTLGEKHFYEHDKREHRRSQKGDSVRNAANHLSGCNSSYPPLGCQIPLDRCAMYDHQDWEGESGKMADIYHNSFITIAATSADSPKTGCFSASPTSELKLGSVYAQLIHHFPNSPTDNGSTRFPLLTRA